MRTGRQVASLFRARQEIYGVAASSDGRLLAAGDQDGNIHLWELKPASCWGPYPGAGLALRLTFNQDGAWLRRF
jgi:hypothetical protein